MSTVKRLSTSRTFLALKNIVMYGNMGYKIVLYRSFWAWLSALRGDFVWLAIILGQVVCPLSVSWRLEIHCMELVHILECPPLEALLYVHIGNQGVCVNLRPES